jgi:hypothetical protein
MKHIVSIGLICGIMALCGCTTEKAPAPQQQIPAITLSTADKEKLMSFQKEILNIENLTDKAVKLALDELKNVIKGGEVWEMVILTATIKPTANLSGQSVPYSRYVLLMIS